MFAKFTAIVTAIKRLIVAVLLVLMLLVVIFAALDLAVELGQDLIAGPRPMLIDVHGLMDVFSMFLLVVIGIELLDSIWALFLDGRFHAETVLLAALTAVARKIVVMDVKEMAPLTIAGIALLALSLAAGYYLLHRSRLPMERPP